MKKLFLAFALLASCMINAQDYEIKNGAITITKIIETSLTAVEIYDATQTFFAGSYGDSNKTQRLNTENHLIYNGLFVNVNSNSYMAVDYKHSIDVSIKENRVKIQVSCKDGQYYGKGEAARYDYDIVESYPISKTNKCPALAKKLYEGAVTGGVKRMHEAIAAYEEALKQKLTEEDW